MLTLSLTSVAAAAPSDPVKFVGLLEQMRGHYDAMLFNYQRGNTALALKHASHPANELYSAVKTDLTPALQTRFLNDYNTINGVLKARKPVATLQAALHTFSADVDAAIATLPAATRQDPKFGARVISTILGNTKTEYSGGVANGQVSSVTEYQDAQFYLARATGWLAKYRAQFPADQGGQAAAALSQAKTVFSAKAEPQVFNTQLDRARTELAEISGDTLAATSGPAADFASIQTLLATARSHYRSGMTDAANEAVISAYLDHFEQLEAPLATKNKPLELKLEETLKNGLRALIKQKVPPTQFSAALDATLKDLKTAQGLLE
ncbi:hypothetical protein GCM10008957_43270 [Deinococcus ruber]|uniref:Uncharacterized protein n=1 Tax=Deinococcus ruber TaxID=1848197 RepID=A0A918FCJ5_9DEIO|nr:hypothetical protein GCM10008957_43270 [Deinococcus ruber]